MDRTIPMLLIGLVFGGGLGFTLAAANGVTLDGHDHADPAHHGPAATAHAHDETLNLPAGPDAPALSLVLHDDPGGGWNLELVTRNFRYAPENASRDHVPGEGHAHVYVNGVKILRSYGPWLHLATLPDGRADIHVTLTSNDHRALAVNGRPVSATLTVSN